MEQQGQQAQQAHPGQKAIQGQQVHLAQNRVLQVLRLVL